MNPKYLAIQKLTEAQPVHPQPAPNYREVVAPAPQANRYQQALDAQLAKAKAIGMQRNQQAQARTQAAAKPVAQAQPQQADPQALISNGLRTGVLSYGDLDQVGLSRDQFNKFREGVEGIKRQYGMKQ